MPELTSRPGLTWPGTPWRESSRRDWHLGDTVCSLQIALFVCIRTRVIRHTDRAPTSRVVDRVVDKCAEDIIIHKTVELCRETPWISEFGRCSMGMLGATPPCRKLGAGRTGQLLILRRTSPDRRKELLTSSLASKQMVLFWGGNTTVLHGNLLQRPCRPAAISRFQHPRWPDLRAGQTFRWQAAQRGAGQAMLPTAFPLPTTTACTPNPKSNGESAKTAACPAGHASPAPAHSSPRGSLVETGQDSLQRLFPLSFTFLAGSMMNEKRPK